MRKPKKRRFLTLNNTFFIHVAVYVVMNIAYWYAFVAALAYEGNEAVPRSVFEALGFERINFSLTWALILLIHLSLLLAYKWWKQRQIEKADRHIRWDEAPISERLLDKNHDDITDAADLMQSYQDDHLAKQEQV